MQDELGERAEDSLKFLWRLAPVYVLLDAYMWAVVLFSGFEYAKAWMNTDWNVKMVGSIVLFRWYGCELGLVAATAPTRPCRC